MRALLLIFGILWASTGNASELLVIASEEVPDTSISIEQLAAIYAMKKISWSNGTQVVPVNREASSDERAKFSKVVFNLSPQDLSAYQDRLRFQGKLPPIVQSSDQAVLGFVRSVPGAIGYINASHAPTGVKTLMRLP